MFYYSFLPRTRKRLGLNYTILYYTERMAWSKDGCRIGHLYIFVVCYLFLAMQGYICSNILHYLFLRGGIPDRFDEFLLCSVG